MVKFDTPQYNNPNKHFVQVQAVFDLEGDIMPNKIFTDEGAFEVDKIVDIRPAASLKSGGVGMRYKCYICSKPTYLFLEDTKWFYELCE